LIVVLRFALVGFALWIAAFNRWCMVDQDDRRKLRRGGWLFLALVGLPVVAALLWPEALDGPTWVVFSMLVLLEGWRLITQAVGFTTARSNLVPVPGCQGGRLATQALQVRSWQFPDAPSELDGLTVVFLSDLHCNGYPSCQWYDKVWDTVRAIGPDLLLLGGDYLDTPQDLPILKRCLQGLGRIAPPLGTYAVLGNHDEIALPDVRQLLRQSGAALLEDRWVALRRPDDRSFLLHGTSAPFAGSSDPLRGVPPGGAHISLVHTPDVAPALADRGSKYILSGHLHGGQVAIPFFGALIVPSRFSRRWTYGGFRVGDAHLVVTSGIGSVGLPVRILARPEITAIRFHS
jgi:uncharacterized protein